MILKFTTAPHVVSKGPIRLVRYVVGVWLTRASLNAGNPPAASEEFFVGIPPKTKTVPVVDGAGNPTGETQVVNVNRQAILRGPAVRWLRRLVAMAPAARTAKIAALRTARRASGFARVQGDHDDILRDFTPPSEVEL